MKKRGRSAAILTAAQLGMIEEYLTSDKSYQEIADKYGVGKGALQYWTQKYRRLSQIKQEEDNSRCVVCQKTSKI